MADRNAFQSLLRAKVSAAIGLARAAGCVTHQGLKGDFLEVLVSQLFRPLLPADIGVGSGQILCSYTGRLSTQVDIILYDRNILPPLLIDDRIGIFPIEAVLYAIEVKTTLNKGELQSAHENALKLLSNFGYRPGLADDARQEKHHRIEKVRSVLFALGSDLTGRGRSEIDRYKEVQGRSLPAIRALCVAGREYWFENNRSWYGATDSDEFDGVLAFLAGIMNSYRFISQSRGYPRLGNYIASTTTLTRVEAGPRMPTVRCERCNSTYDFKVNVGPAQIVVEGALMPAKPCPACGGELWSEAGRFESIGTILMRAPADDGGRKG